jgi:hypothetical protein
VSCLVDDFGKSTAQSARTPVISPLLDIAIAESID